MLKSSSNLFHKNLEAVQKNLRNSSQAYLFKNENLNYAPDSVRTDSRSIDMLKHRSSVKNMHNSAINSKYIKKSYTEAIKTQNFERDDHVSPSVLEAFENLKITT